MKRPLLLFVISLSIGIIQSYLIDSVIFSLIAIFILTLLLAYLKRTYLLKNFFVFGLILFYSIGVLEYSLVKNINENRFIGFSEKYVVIKGYVADNPEVKGQKISYIIRTDEISINDESKHIKGRVILSTPLNDENTIYRYGQGLEIRGKISIPTQQRNPKGFNYRRYLATAGISATIFAQDFNISLLDHTYINPIVKSGLVLRERIITVVNNSLPKEQAGLLNGMLIGYRDGLEKEVQNAFSDAGLTHIMAVSGANIAFIVFPLVLLFKRLRISQKLANIMIILLLILFVFVTGFSPSVVRAVIMAIVMLIAQILRRDTDVYTSISVAAIILMIYNPYVLFDIGFQLSFGATISLVLFYNPIKGKLKHKFIPAFLADLIAVTTAAQIGVVPLTAFYFNKISIISLASNIFVVPLTGLITIIGFIMAILGQFSLILSEMAGWINNTLLTFILYITKISSEFPFATLKLATPNILIVILYYIVIVLLFWYKPKYKPELTIKPQYYFAIILVLVLLFNIYRVLPGKLEVVFVDVGQGDCTLIKSSSGKTVLIDGGGTAARADKDMDSEGSITLNSEQSNIGDTTVIPFLYDYGVSKLDIVIATHGHDDHIEGLFPVLEKMEVDKLIIPESQEDVGLKSLVKMAEHEQIPVYKCVEGNIIELDSDTHLKVIHPAKGFKIDKSSSNNGSLVIKLLYKKISMLFTGDIEKETEEVLTKNRNDLRADVIKIPHHGSPYSSTSGFIDSVKPQVAVISVGKNNFGHPSEAVLERMKERNIKIYRTDESGALLLESDGKRITIKRTIGE